MQNNSSGNGSLSHGANLNKKDDSHAQSAPYMVNSYGEKQYIDPSVQTYSGSQKMTSAETEKLKQEIRSRNNFNGKNVTSHRAEAPVPQYVTPPPAADNAAPAMSDIERRCEDAHLNPKYIFDTFIVGNNNKFAQAAALAVAESPGDTYNPLFIYGGAGLGKTHLMHSIAHYIIEHDENSKVLFIIGKESTQEEFFHTFNSLHSAKKQIIISSDKPPKDMEILEERFRSRFEWGLIADITLPDYETRMAILHKKEDLEGYNISEEVINYIATNIKSNIRELEGAFNKVMASSKLEKRSNS